MRAFGGQDKPSYMRLVLHDYEISMFGCIVIKQDCTVNCSCSSSVPFEAAGFMRSTTADVNVSARSTARNRHEYPGQDFLFGEQTQHMKIKQANRKLKCCQRWHFGQYVLPLLLPTWTVYLHATTRAHSNMIGPDYKPDQHGAGLVSAVHTHTLILCVFVSLVWTGERRAGQALRFYFLSVSFI